MLAVSGFPQYTFVLKLQINELFAIQITSLIILNIHIYCKFFLSNSCLCRALILITDFIADTSRIKQPERNCLADAILFVHHKMFSTNQLDWRESEGSFQGSPTESCAV